ncbi:hypothetical protein Q9L58_010472 [Maublancomyces gigas]|uniref:Uncharacterized protein n=1 Tax=Discina gigas TaxID=1032678 RepID=A0ABR3G487_9PEZI
MDQPPSSMLASPNEILATVASNMNPTGLHSLSQTNHRLHRVVAPYLQHAFLEHKDSILVWAARRNNAPTMNRAIESGATIPFEKLLREAGRYGLDHTARVMLDVAAGFVYQKDEEVFILFHAIWRRHINVTRMLLERGVLANSIAFRSIALSIAVLGNTIELVELLVAHGADAKLIRHPKRRFLTAVRQRNVEIMKVFLDAGLLAGMTQYRGNGDPVHVVARFGTVEMMQLLLEYGASVDALGRYGCCPLHQTVLYAGRDDMQRFLLDTGADMNVKNHHGYTPLHTAVCRGNVAAVRMLLEYGADAGMVRRHQWKPVRARAVGRRLGSRENVIEALVEYGVLLES